MSALSELNQQIGACQKCQVLTKNRTNVVPGEGAEDAEIMFIGEAPGWNEDKQGLPFVGQAGMFLNELLASINLRRNQIYITNIIKCRPQGNRDPLLSEIQNCRPWLDRQIEIISPKMIVTLGRYSMATFFPGKSISKIHGTALKKDNIIYYAMYHPAAALHQRSLRQTIQDDMKRIPSLLASAEAIKPVTPEAQQLTMFEV
ncbi:MAG: uracil-DNA glycosylase [Dehalococcoidales bacterium]|nr:uracil-DNA glycosylase [Dehalococcoidales bacterium]